MAGGRCPPPSPGVTGSVVQRGWGRGTLCSPGGLHGLVPEPGTSPPPPPLFASAQERPQDEKGMQRLKRSLSLKTILRSKSVENFFLRSNSELKLPCEAPMRTHSFQEHVFRKHSPCEMCHQLIVGGCRGDPVPRAGELTQGRAATSASANAPDLSPQSPAFPAWAPPSPSSTAPRSQPAAPCWMGLHIPHTHNPVPYLCPPDRRQDLAGSIDLNEDWWKGKIGDRVGFLPANFVQRVLKENEGFLKVTSGKKRGLVPADALTEMI
uniref:SH3 and cysteine rich domain 2 n=1 Tax=Chelonoidis abingdonii TaxID=106734 RepID=A0A8C0JCG4_CHEAB